VKAAIYAEEILQLAPLTDGAYKIKKLAELNYFIFCNKSCLLSALV